MQECNCTVNDFTRWRLEWGAPVFFSAGDTNGRGVMILFKNNFEYKLHTEQGDNNGRYILLDLTVEHIRFTLACLYGPNEDLPEFFHDLNEKISSLGNDSVIMVGDWNVVRNFHADTDGRTRDTHMAARHEIASLCEEYHLIDIWRMVN